MFLLFAGDYDTTERGAYSLIGDFDTLDECIESANRKRYTNSPNIEYCHYQWANALNTETFEVTEIEIK